MMRLTACALNAEIGSMILAGFMLRVIMRCVRGRAGYVRAMVLNEL